MALPPLDDERLHVLVFGPGVGELVLVRVPPGEWLAIDGCASAGTPYARRVLSHYAAIPRAILFTHPHLDHARGLADIVDDATSGSTGGFVSASDSRSIRRRCGRTRILRVLRELDGVGRAAHLLLHRPSRCVGGSRGW